MKYFLLILPLLFISCSDISKVEVEENPLLFFWEEMDKRYVYFDEKQVSWDSVRNTLHLYNPASTSELLAGFQNMITILDDHHVWVDTGEELISTPFQNFYNGFPIDLERYIPNITIDRGIYKIAQLANGVVFIEVRTLRKSFDGIQDFIQDFSYSNGIIVDVRNCPGGQMICALEFASYFIDGKHTVLYERFKNGRGHNDFTDLYPISLLGQGTFKDTKLVLITDAGTYSACNTLVSIMKNFTDATIVGSSTGGGGASGSKSVLPNGWVYSISETPYFDANCQSLENGVTPHVFIDFGLTEWQDYLATKIHSQMEFAYKLLTE